MCRQLLLATNNGQSIMLTVSSINSNRTAIERIKSAADPSQETGFHPVNLRVDTFDSSRVVPSVYDSWSLVLGSHYDHSACPSSP